MKKILYLLPLLLTMCTSSDENGNEPSENAFEFTAEVSATTIAVDQIFQITFTSDEQLTNVQVSQDNFVSFRSCGANNSNVVTTYHNYGTPGTRTLYFRATNANNETSVKTMTIEVVRGNAVKINHVTVNSYSTMGDSWDPEFSNVDPNRLADLRAGFSKVRLTEMCTTQIFEYPWHVTPVIMNETGMSWDLSNAQLYCDPAKVIGFGLSDDEGNGTAQDMINTYPGKYFSFAAYTATRPETITFDYPEIELSFTVTVEWPEL